MSKFGIRTAAAAFGALLLTASAYAQDPVEIAIGDVEGAAPGSNVTIEVSLATNGAQVAGTQNDITFGADTGARIVALSNGKPDCTVNAAINKTGTQFAFQPPNCTGDACTGVRAIVINFGDLSPIPDGSILYTCNVAIAADAASGDILLENTGAGASDPSGGDLPTEGIDGTITVVGEAAATIIIGSATGQPGDTVDIAVSLDTGVDVAGTQNDFSFAAPLSVPVGGVAGRPDCTVNPVINKTGTQFAFQPPNCEGSACNAVRAIVINFGDLSPIPTGSELYRCRVVIAEDAEEGTYELPCSNAGASDPAGGELETACTAGSITVGDVQVASVLAADISADATEIPLEDASGFPASGGTVQIGDEIITYTGIDGNTLTGAQRGQFGTTAAAHSADDEVVLIETPNTPTPTVTTEPTETPTPGAGGGGNDDDGCAVVAPSESNTGWLLLLPAAALLWLRRRSR